MVLTEDSRPFTGLRKKAEGFKSVFNAGVEKCILALDSGISDLLCDPDSREISATGAKRLSAHMEFSKAKYELFVQMRELFENCERNWNEYISEMKEQFLEDVEIFLAGTKLEVKLPTSEVLSQIEKQRSPGSKTCSGNSPTASSLYPKLFDSAKKQISRLSSFLPLAENTEFGDDNDEKEQSVSTPFRQNGRSSKRVTIITPQELKKMAAVSVAVDNSDVVQVSDSDEEEPAVLQITSRKSGRKPNAKPPASQKKIPARTTRKNPAPSTLPESSSDSSDTKSANAPVRRRSAKSSEKQVNESIVNRKDTEESLPPQVEIKGRRATRSQLSTPTVQTPSSVSGRKTRTPRGKANASENSEQVQVGPKTPKSVHFSTDMECHEDSAIQKTPRGMQYSVGMDITEDLDVYSPEVKVSRATPRRKTTVLSRTINDITEIDLTLDTTAPRGKSKRKTIAASALDETVASSPKKLKLGRRSNILPPTSGNEDAVMNFSSLASDGASEQEHYSPWIPLSDISGSVPPQPGVYELKVAAAKKPAYIGGCDSLRQKLTLHKLKQNSGHKHLDKFIDRNLSSILVRYEALSSAAESKAEEKLRVKAFVERFKNPPAYN